MTIPRCRSTAGRNCLGWRTLRFPPRRRWTVRGFFGGLEVINRRAWHGPDQPGRGGIRGVDALLGGFARPEDPPVARSATSAAERSRQITTLALVAGESYMTRCHVAVTHLPRLTVEALAVDPDRLGPGAGGVPRGRRIGRNGSCRNNSAGMAWTLPATRRGRSTATSARTGCVAPSMVGRDTGRVIASAVHNGDLWTAGTAQEPDVPACRRLCRSPAVRDANAPGSASGQPRPRDRGLCFAHGSGSRRARPVRCVRPDRPRRVCRRQRGRHRPQPLLRALIGGPG